MKSFNHKNPVQDNKRMNEWKEFKLGDVAERITSGGTPSTSNPSYYDKGNIPWLNTKEINFCRIYETEKYITELGMNNSSAKWIERNSVIVAMYGATAGKVAINKIPITTNQACCNITLKDEVADYNFVFYYLWNKYSEIENIATGAAQQNLSVNVISNLDILLPPLPEQKAIAEVLSSLDDKIDLLHRQNKTLEQLAETLFRNWFAEDEWNGSLGEYIKVQNGYAFKSKDFKENGYAGVIKIKNISMGSIDITNHDCVDKSVVENLDKKFKIKTGDFLIAMTGAEIGKIGIVEKTDKEIWLNQRVGKLEARVPYGDLIGYLALKSREGQEHITNACAGSAQENISSSGIEEMSFASFNEQKVNSLGVKIQPLFEKIIFNQGQIRTLTQLRDTLLPKLMSGEVRVSEK